MYKEYIINGSSLNVEVDTDPRPKHKRGGRKKGSKNKVHPSVQMYETACHDIKGFTPLSFLLDVMSSPQYELKDRIDAARAALPYCHKKMPTQIEADINVKQYTLVDVLTAAYESSATNPLLEGEPERLRNDDLSSGT